MPAITQIEYGETDCYGQKTDIDDSYYYQHLHYIKNLKQDTTYHYRIKYQDYDGNVYVTGDKTFKTLKITDEILVTNDLVPLTITESGKYVFMEDITSDTLGINIKANDVT
ncbi:MAG: hypothetical protein LBQ59_00935, partial [Candidatus Peribacteria bacterium]|nr:hypothetical protein [Candidatus Peribacteria bacterium]